MMRLGTAPYLECSSRGDRRFSAFYAHPASLNGMSIEEAYQAAKIFVENGQLVTGKGWREAKGRRAENANDIMSLYAQWWAEWVEQEGLLPVLKTATGLSDMFGREGSVCQAMVLWTIRCGAQW